MIKTEAVFFRYPEGSESMHDVNMEVRAGEFMALMGANGCGKTTLLKHLIGLLKPSSGRVILKDKDMRAMKDEEVFRQVGMVFQDPNDQLFAATVQQDVSFGAVNIGLGYAEVSVRTAEALRMVDASGLQNKAIHSLSFGQKKRITIAGVLVMEPRIILLDEPTSGLDPQGTSTIMRLLRRLNREKGISMLMTTHDVELISLYCDRVAIMGQGTVLAAGAPSDILTNTSVMRAAGLRLPRIAHLAEILQKRDAVNFSKIPLTISEARQEICGLLGKDVTRENRRNRWLA